VTPPAWEHGELSWFCSETSRATDAARDVCKGCLVREQCLAYALPDPHISGVWGGFSDRERATARRRGWDAAHMLAELDGSDAA
jgi:hypothetical protein